MYQEEVEMQKKIADKYPGKISSRDGKDTKYSEKKVGQCMK